MDADYRQDARRALSSDVYHVQFDRGIDFHYDLFAFRTPFGRTDLTAAFAVRSSDLASIDAGDGRVTYPVLLSVVLIDTLSGEVTRRDTLQRIESRVP